MITQKAALPAAMARATAVTIFVPGLLRHYCDGASELPVHAATVREAFELMYYLDCACQIQVDACAGGMENVLEMSQRAGDEAAKQFNRPDRPSTHKDWPALLRLLERKGSNYAS